MSIRRREGVTEPVRLEGTPGGTGSEVSRRRALRLLGGGLAGGVLALRGVPASFAASPRCKHVGEDCERNRPCCNGVCCAGICCPPGQICQNGTCVTPPPATNRQICVCGDGTVFDQICTSIDCASSEQQDSICAPLCAAHGGEFATGCLTDDPLCVR
jgi:hypothetical protein